MAKRWVYLISLAAVAMAGCGSGSSAPAPSAKAIERAISAKVDGTWSSGGPDLVGAYRQAFFTGAGRGISQIDIEWFHSTADASAADHSQYEALAVYQAGSLLVVVSERASNVENAAVAAIAGMDKT